MKRPLRSILTAVVVTATIAACADPPQAPRAELVAPPVPAASLGALTRPSAGAATVMQAAQWKVPLTASVTASAVIDARGGTLSLPQTGTRVYVPAGAVSKATTFVVTARAGKLVAFDFGPEGSVFPVPLVLVQDQGFVDRSTAPSGVSVQTSQLGYFRSGTDLDQARGAANVSELRPTVVVSTPQAVGFPIWHFSGYIVCWGRQVAGDNANENSAMY